MSKIQIAVIPAAGQGTRLKPLTDKTPKELLPVKGKPMIYHALKEATLCGVKKLVVVVSPRKPSLIHYLEKEWPKEARAELGKAPELKLVFQPEPLGSGEALYRAKGEVGEDPFLWLMPDFYLEAKRTASEQILQTLSPSKGVNLVGLLALKPERFPFFGKVGYVKEAVITPEGRFKIKELSSKGENPPQTLSGPVLKAVGRWVLWPEVFEWLERTRGGDEWDDTPALQMLCLHGKVIGVILEGKGFDLGNPLGYRDLEASALL